MIDSLSLIVLSSKIAPFGKFSELKPKAPLHRINKMQAYLHRLQLKFVLLTEGLSHKASSVVAPDGGLIFCLLLVRGLVQLDLRLLRVHSFQIVLALFKLQFKLP